MKTAYLQALLAALVAIMLIWHLTLLARLMPLKKDQTHARTLSQNPSGIVRLWEFASQPMRELYSPQAYTIPGQRLLPWVRVTGLLAGSALALFALTIP